MKLKKPLTLDSEAQYLSHCANIAQIIAHIDNDVDIDGRFQKYVEITDAEIEDVDLEKCRAELKPTSLGEKKLCPRCHAEVEFAQDPLRICTHCGWRGDFTKLEET